MGNARMGRVDLEVGFDSWKGAGTLQQRLFLNAPLFLYLRFVLTDR